MSVERPTRPAVSDYPNTFAHSKKLEEAKELFEKELASPESEWEDQGEREGVRLWKKVDPEVGSALTSPSARRDVSSRIALSVSATFDRTHVSSSSPVLNAFYDTHRYT